MSRRHNRFQPALSPLEGRVSLSTQHVVADANNAHIDGYVTVHDHKATWNLDIKDTIKDGSRVRVELDMDLPFRPDPRKFGPWAGDPSPVKVNWKDSYQYGFPTPLDGVHVKVERENAGSVEVAYVKNT